MSGGERGLRAWEVEMVNGDYSSMFGLGLKGQ